MDDAAGFEGAVDDDEESDEPEDFSDELDDFSEEPDEPEPLVAVIVALNVPGVVGVPEITPLELFSVRPAGSPVAENPVVPLVATMV